MKNKIFFLLFMLVIISFGVGFDVGKYKQKTFIARDCTQDGYFEVGTKDRYKCSKLVLEYKEK